MEYLQDNITSTSGSATQVGLGSSIVVGSELLASCDSRLVRRTQSRHVGSTRAELSNSCPCVRRDSEGLLRLRPIEDGGDVGGAQD